MSNIIFSRRQSRNPSIFANEGDTSQSYWCIRPPEGFAKITFADTKTSVRQLSQMHSLEADHEPIRTPVIECADIPGRQCPTEFSTPPLLYQSIMRRYLILQSVLAERPTEFRFNHMKIAGNNNGG